MERRDHIRAAMQSLLSPVRQPEPERRGAAPRPAEVPPVSLRGTGTLALSPAQQRVLSELQATLHENGIVAELPEIVQALVEALTARPSLCQGLLAAYLLEE